MRIVAALPLALAACATPDGAPPSEPAAACNAAAVADLVGRPWKDAEAARRRAGARTVRVAGPDDAVTMDYRPDRLDVRLDGSGKVTRIACG